MKQRKAQAAMEFLMTYGWAILVVLVAIGALAYFGVLNPERLVADKCFIAPGSGVICDDFAAAAAGSTTDALTVVLQNTAGELITVSEVSTDDPSCLDAVSQDVAVDSTATFNLNCTTATTAGKKKAVLTVKFSKTVNVTKTVLGDLIVTVA